MANYNPDFFDPNRSPLEDMPVLQDNIKFIRSSFAGDTPPTNPVAGQLWADTANGLLKVYMGGWKIVGGGGASETISIVNEAAKVKGKTTGYRLGGGFEFRTYVKKVTNASIYAYVYSPPSGGGGQVSFTLNGAVYSSGVTVTRGGWTVLSNGENKISYGGGIITGSILVTKTSSSVDVNLSGPSVCLVA